MKQAIKLSFYLLILFVFTACKKSPKATCSDGIKNQEEANADCGGECSPCPITYPETGTHGLNILYGTDTLVQTGSGNSFSASIPQGSSLEIEMMLLGGSGWAYNLGSVVGWSVSDFSNGSQNFSTLNAGTTDLQIVRLMPTQNDTILIKYFENGNVESRRKILIWQ